MTDRRDVGGIHLSEYAYSGGMTVPRHVHQRAYVCLVVAGHYVERTRQTTRDCNATSVVFHPAGEEHEDRFAPSGGRIFQVELPPALIDVGSKIHALDEHALPATGEARTIARQMRRELHAWDTASPLAIEGLALQLVAELARPAMTERSVPAWWQRCVELLRARFRERMTVGEIARELDVHPARLAREFRARERCTLGEYVRRLRIEHVCRALVRSDTSLSRIALDAGFADHAHLSRVFRRHVGITPSAYRRAS